MKSWKVLASALLIGLLSACASTQGKQQTLSNLQSPLTARIKPRPPVQMTQTVRDERSLIEAFSREQGLMLNIAMGASYGVRHTVLSPFMTKILKEGAKDFATLRANSEHAQAALFIPEPLEFKGTRAQISEDALEKTLVQHEKLLLIFEQAQKLPLSANLSLALRDMQARYQRNAQQLLQWSEDGMPHYVAPKSKAKKSKAKSSSAKSKASKAKSSKSKSSKSKSKSNKKTKD